jgi:hypothetical protein
MRVYLDSSGLLKWVIEESESEHLRVVLRSHANERAVLLSSQLAPIEVSRAIRMWFRHRLCGRGGLRRRVRDAARRRPTDYI